jgi:hypothetical protein
MLNSGMGQTTIEISDLPLIPGREYHAVIAQHGHVTMNSLEVSLICEEEATFMQGTDIRTEVREVYRHQCAVWRDFRIEPAIPFTTTCGIPVPASVMHSFQSPHNVVRWRLVVRGEPQNWPAFERGFPLVVYPGEATMKVEAEARDGRSVLPETIVVRGASA